MIETKKLFAIKLANKRSLCGRPIKKGDILWICKQCGQDNTCVQCDDCFQLSDHTDHEVYFHRSSEGGGCCDCGDTEAWRESGTCSKHGLDPHAQGVDPLSVLPASLVLGLSAVLRGALLVLQQASIAAVDGFNCPENNPFIRHHIKHLVLSGSGECDEDILVRIHNDDVHSYLEVTSALQQSGMDGVTARQLTEAVDKEGSAEVCCTRSIKKLQSCWDALGKAPVGLCVSMLPSRLASVEAALPVLLGIWLQHLAASNDGLMRLVCNALMMPTEDLILASRGRVADVDVDLATLFLPSSAPGEVAPPQLRPFPAHLPLRGNVPSGEFPSISNAAPPHVLLSLGADGVALAPHSSRAETGSAAAAVAAAASTTSISRVDPFNSCDAEDIPFCPRVVFAVEIACSPYVPKAMKKCLNSLVIFLQQDVVFKLGFSQLLVHLYPTLLALFCQGIGTNSDSIFGTSVQVFTADSVVRMMSSDGVDTRPFQCAVPSTDDVKTAAAAGLLQQQEEATSSSRQSITVCTDEKELNKFSTSQKHICIAPTLVAALLTSVKFAGLTKESVYSVVNPAKSRLSLSGKDIFLGSFIVKNKRAWNICRDIEYVVGCSDRSLDFVYAIARGTESCTALDYWLELCALLHGVNGHKRIPRTENHVSHDDDDKWQVAISLLLDLESVSTSVLRNVFAVGKRSLPAASGCDETGTKLDILSVITEKTFKHLSMLESYLPLEDLEGVYDMFKDSSALAPSPRAAQPLMASVSIPQSRKDLEADEKEDAATPELWSAFDILSPAPQPPCGWPSLEKSKQTSHYRCHWESSFSVGRRGRVSVVTPLGRFLAKTFVCAAEAGIAQHELSHYVQGLSEPSISRSSSMRSRDTSEARTTQSLVSRTASPAIEEVRPPSPAVPFEYGMKYGLNEMYNAMSNATSEMSASGSAGYSSVRNRLSEIRSTINDISNMVQSVNVVEQYGGMDRAGDDDVAWSDSPVAARFKSVCLVCEYSLRNLSLAAQVDRGMWRRNGNSVANLIYNYNRPVLSRNFRDLDVAAVQLGVLWLGPEVVLRNMVTIFEVFPEVLEDEGSGNKEDKEVEAKKEDEKGIFGSKSIYGMYSKKSGESPARTSDASIVPTGSSSSVVASDSSEKKQQQRPRALSELKLVVSDMTTEDKGVMMSEMLRVLCHLVTYLPCDLTEDSRTQVAKNEEEEESKDDSFGAEAHGLGRGAEVPREGLTQSLDRLILHMVLSGQRSLSKLNTAKHMLGKDDAISDAMIEESVRRVCSSSDEDSAEKSKSSSSSKLQKLSFDVNPAMAAALFNPEFPFLSASDLHTACENMKTISSTSLGEETSSAHHSSGLRCPPVLATTALPVPHPLFYPLRESLFSSTYFVQLLCSVAEFLVHPANIKKKGTASKKKVSESSALTLEPSVMGELASRLVHLATLRLHSLSSTGSAGVVDRQPSEQWEARLLRAMGTLYALAATGALQSFTSPPGLEWVLAQHWRRDETAQQCLRSVGADMTEAFSLPPSVATTASSSGPHSKSLKKKDLSVGTKLSGDAGAPPTAQEERQLELQARKEAARTRAINFINAQAESFKKSLREEAEKKGGETKKDEAADKGAQLPECILCREVTTGTLGYFVHIQPSTLLTRSLQVPAPLAAQSTKDDDLTYRSRESICCTVPSSNGSRKMMLYCNSADDPRYVVTPCAGYEAEDLSRRGLVLYSKRETCAELEVAVPTSLSLEGEGQSVVVPPGQVVEVIRRVGHWVKIRVLLQPAAGHDDKCFDEDVNGERSAAVVGWAELFSHVPSAHGKRGGVSAARSGSNYSYMTNLTPLKDLEFARHGQAHPFMSSCGHAIHADCWDTYMASCLSSHINSRGFNRMSFMNPEIGEVLCPMCKSIGNSFLPMVGIASPGAPSRLRAQAGDVASLAQWVASTSLSASTMKEGVDEHDAPASTTQYYSDWSKRSRDLVEAVLCHSQVGFKSTTTGNYVVDEAGPSRRDEYGFLNGAFGLNKFTSANELEVKISTLMRKSIGRMRMLHSLWGIISYSLLSSALLKEAQVQSPEVSEASLMNRRLLLPLFQCASAAEQWGFGPVTDAGASFLSTVTRPLEALLLLRPSTLDFNAASSATGKTSSLLTQLARQPLPVVFDSLCPEDNRNIDHLLKQIIKSVVEDNNVDPKMDASTEACLWPVLHQPTLTQDLHVLIICALCSCSPPTSLSCEEGGELPPALCRAKDLSSLICLARLLQILVENGGEVDCAGGDSLAPDEEASGKKRLFAAMRGQEESGDVSGLCALRRLACGHVGISLPSTLDAGHNVRVYESVRSRWMPFLEFARQALCLLRISLGLEGQSGELAEGGGPSPLSVRDRFVWLLEQLGLGGLLITASGGRGGDGEERQIDFSAGLLLELAAGWGKQYTDYYDIKTTSPVARGGRASLLQWPRLMRRDLCESSSDEEEAADDWGSDEDDDEDDEDDDRGMTVDAAGDEMMMMMGGDLGFHEGVAQMLEAHMDMIGHGDDDDYYYGDGDDGHDEMDVEAATMADETAQELEVVPTAVVGDGFSDYMHNNEEEEDDEEEDYEVDEVDEDDDDGMDDDDDDDDDDDLGGAGVRDEMSRWLREMGVALAAGGGLDLTAIQERLSGLPGFEEMSARQMQMMRDALMAGQTRVQQQLQRGQDEGTGQQAQQQELGQGQGGGVQNGKEQAVVLAKPWPLLGVQPYFNPFRGGPDEHRQDQEGAVEGETRGSAALCTGSVTGTVSCLISSRAVHQQRAVPLCVLDKSHSGVPLVLKRRLLIELPNMFTTLYKQAKIPPFSQTPRVAMDEPAVCLVCGQLVSAGSRLPATSSSSSLWQREANMSPGECTLHARTCGAGTGLFFLVEKCSVLLLHGTHACYWPTLYLDKNGDAPTGGSIAGQNRPLFLSQDRYAQLEKLYAEHKIIREVIRIRSNEERILRLNWY